VLCLKVDFKHKYRRLTWITTGEERKTPWIVNDFYYEGEYKFQWLLLFILICSVTYMKVETNNIHALTFIAIAKHFFLIKN
jgi:hypothetical protein